MFLPPAPLSISHSWSPPTKGVVHSLSLPTSLCGKHLQSSGNSIHKQIWPEVNIDIGCRMLDTTPTSQMVDEKRIHETWKKSSHLENSKCHFASAKGTVELDRFITWCKAKCAGRGVPNSHPFFKKSLHSRVWLEGLSFPGAEISKSGWTALWGQGATSLEVGSPPSNRFPGFSVKNGVFPLCHYANILILKKYGTDSGRSPLISPFPLVHFAGKHYIRCCLIVPLFWLLSAFLCAKITSMSIHE
jgi:hypothetical protein